MSLGREGEAGPLLLTRRKRVAGYSLVLAPGVVGAVLDAPWILTLAVVGVALFFATRAGVLVAPREVRQTLAKNLVLASITIALGIIVAPLVSDRHVGLVVAGWGVICDVVWRAWPDGVIVRAFAKRGSSSGGPPTSN